MSNRITERNEKVLDAALEEALDVGFPQMRRDSVAKRAGIAIGGVNNAYGTIDALRDEVMRVAVVLADADPKYLPIVAAGIVGGHPFALAASKELKAAALQPFA